MRRFGTELRAGVRRLFVPAVRSRRRTFDDMEAEVRAHLDARVDYLVARGMNPAAARAEAERRFGGMERAMDMLKTSAVERERALGVRERIKSVAQDARFVLRGLGRSPAFTAGVVATLTLGLGINSAVFRVADRVLFRAPDGVENPRSLRRLSVPPAFLANNSPLAVTMSYREVQTVVESRVFGGVAAYSPPRPLRLPDGSDAQIVYVDSGYFRLLGVRATQGRLFDVHEAEPGAEEPVAVVSHDYWRRALGSQPLSSNLSLTLGNRVYRVIGVAPAGFTGVDLDPVEVWLPLGVAQLGRGVVNGVPMPWWRMDGVRPLRVFVRMADGVRDGPAADRIARVLSRLDERSTDGPRTAQLRSINAISDATDVSQRVLARLAGVALVVLVIAAANAANLLLARALRRRREIAVRMALGGSRSRIVRLLLLESVALGLTGGAAAGLAGYWTGESLRRVIFPDARWATAALDDRTIVFTLAVALLAGLVAGLAPALQLSNPDVVTALKDDRHRAGRGSRLTRTALVVTQTAFSLALLIGSGLLVRSLYTLNAIRIGFDDEGLVTASVPPQGTFASLLGEWTGARATALDVASRIARHPGVHAVALASQPPFGATAGMGFSVPGRETPDVPPGLGPYYTNVSTNYFGVMGTRLVRGRVFSPSDDRGSQSVVVVNESMARTIWPDGDLFSTCLLLPARGVCARVIGVVEDVRDSRGLGAAMLRYYLPLAQSDDSAAAVIVRADREHAVAVAASLRSMIPPQQRPAIEVVGDRVARALRPWRMATMLFSVIGIIALALASIGVYSVMSYIASERVHELGVRVVLGATPSDIAKLVTIGGLRLVLVGASLGILGAAIASRLLSSLLFGVSPFDPVVYVGATAILCILGVLATAMPAVRVMRTDPTVALRAE